jgi:hypothetical protein
MGSVWIDGVGHARRYIPAQAIADLSADVSERGSDVVFCEMQIVRAAIVTVP